MDWAWWERGRGGVNAGGRFGCGGGVRSAKERGGNEMMQEGAA